MALGYHPNAPGLMQDPFSTYRWLRDEAKGAPAAITSCKVNRTR